MFTCLYCSTRRFIVSSPMSQTSSDYIRAVWSIARTTRSQFKVVQECATVVINRSDLWFLSVKRSARWYFLAREKSKHHNMKKKLLLYVNKYFSNAYLISTRIIVFYFKSQIPNISEQTLHVPILCWLQCLIDVFVKYFLCLFFIRMQPLPDVTNWKESFIWCYTC